MEIVKHPRVRTLGGENFLHSEGVLAFNGIAGNVNRSSASIDNDYVLPDLRGVSLEQIGLDQLPTLIASLEAALLTQKLKLASPSVVKRMRSCPSAVSGMSLALTAALRIVTCSMPPQPFGWLRMKIRSALTEFQTTFPNAWRSLMYVSAQENR